MQILFYRTNQAIHYTLEFYGVYRIKDYLNYLSKPSESHYLHKWDDFVIKIHDQMTDEINQTIHTCTANAQAEMFDFLKNWLNDYRIEKVNVDLIEQKINEYNEKEYAEFLIKVEEKEKRFKLSPNYLNLKNLDKYIVENPSYYGAIGGTWFPANKTTELTYHRFYCIEEKVETIDTSYLPKYLEILEKVICNFKKILVKYITKWDKGEIHSNSTIVINQNPIQQVQPFLLNETSKNIPERIKVKISVKQLAYLIRLLYDDNFFHTKNRSEISRFISNHFFTPGTEINPISSDSFLNNFTTPEKETAKFWVAKLSKMIKEARNF